MASFGCEYGGLPGNWKRALMGWTASSPSASEVAGRESGDPYFVYAAAGIEGTGLGLSDFGVLEARCL